jgi:hypothetical protein
VRVGTAGWLLALRSAANRECTHVACKRLLPRRPQVETARVGLEDAATGKHSWLWHVAQVRAG